jgi:hypothetical protein
MVIDLDQRRRRNTASRRCDRACRLAVMAGRWRRPCSRRRSRPCGATSENDALAKLTGLGEIQFTLPEAGVMGFDEAGLEAFLADCDVAQAFEAGKLRGLETLRRAQFKLAETNATMAIFLGKTYLGQNDRRGQDQGDAFDFSHAAQSLRDRLAAVGLDPSSPDGLKDH